MAENVQRGGPSGPLASANGAHPGGNGAHVAAQEALAPARPIPENVAVKCPNCREMLLAKDWEKNLKVCQRCGYHFQLSAYERIELLVDPKSFAEVARDLRSGDPLRFVSRKIPYPDYVKGYREKTALNEGAVMGRGRIEDMPLVLVVMDFRFIGGSMGTVVGEKITQGIELAAAERAPLLISSASGGARMQEGALSLMQMAKTSAALARLAEVGVPYISLLTDPTTGGVAASFAFLGDVILAEPGALVGFAGPRVIEQFIHQRLPKDTNTSEFLLAHGMIDGVRHRRELRPSLARLLRLYSRATA